MAARRRGRGGRRSSRRRRRSRSGRSGAARCRGRWRAPARARGCGRCRDGRVVAVVGGQDQQVAGAEARGDLGQAGVEGLERAGVAGDVARWPQSGVEVDVVGEDEVAVPRAASIAASVASTSAMSSLPLASVVMPRWAKMSPILPMAWVPPPASITRSRSVGSGGGIARSLRFGGAGEGRGGLADEGPGDDAADAQRVDDLRGDAAGPRRAGRGRSAARARRSAARCRPRCRGSAWPVRDVLLAEGVDDRHARGVGVAEGAGEAGALDQRPGDRGGDRRVGRGK